MKLLWLYPDVLNLHGDRGNILALRAVGGAMGLAPEIKRADALPPLGDIDLILLGAGQLRDMPALAEALRPHAKELSDYAAAGGHILATGSSGCLLGKSFALDGEEPVAGLGLLDMTARELRRTTQPMLTKEVYGDDLWWRSADGAEVIGCQIQRMDFTLGPEAEPLGRVLYGYGNDLSGAEGAKAGGVRFTNTVGPLFCCAPWLGVSLLAECAGVEPKLDETDAPFFAWARAEFEKKKAFIKAKKKLPGIVYAEE